MPSEAIRKDYTPRQARHNSSHRCLQNLSQIHGRGEPEGFDITPWVDRVQLINAKYSGTWELPAIGAVTAPTAVLVRPDGYVAWVGDPTQKGLAEALTTWFGSPPGA